jgi:hypothetical protein
MISPSIAEGKSVAIGMTLTQIIETVYQMKRTGRNHVKSVSEDNFAKILGVDRLECIGNSRLKIIGRMNIVTTGSLVGILSAIARVILDNFEVVDSFFEAVFYFFFAGD